MDSWVVLLIIFLISALGRRVRKKAEKEPLPWRPPRTRRSERQAPRPPDRVLRPTPAPSRPEARPPQRQPQFELPQPWEAGGPSETPSEWETAEEVPAPWSTPEEMRESTLAEARDLLERLSAMTEEAETRAGPEPSGAPSAAVSAPVQRAEQAESARLRDIRRSLSSPGSLRQALVLCEVLRAPTARRPRP